MCLIYFDKRKIVYKLKPSKFSQVNMNMGSLFIPSFFSYNTYNLYNDGTRKSLIPEKASWSNEGVGRQQNKMLFDRSEY